MRDYEDPALTCVVEFDEVTNGLGWRWSEYLGLFGS